MQGSISSVVATPAPVPLADFRRLDLGVQIAVEHHRVLNHSGLPNFC